MKPAYIYIGLAAVAVTFAVLHFAGSVKLKRANEKVSDLKAYAAFLEDQTDDMEKDLLRSKTTLTKLLKRENIYIGKIKMDSTLLNTIKESNEKVDSLSSYYTLDDWNRIIATEISEN